MEHAAATRPSRATAGGRRIVREKQAWSDERMAAYQVRQSDAPAGGRA